MQKKEKKQRKKHIYADRLRYMHMIEEGYSINYISQHYGIDNTLLNTLYIRYNKLGVEGIRKGKNFKASAALKKKSFIFVLGIAEVWPKRYQNKCVVAHVSRTRTKAGKDVFVPNIRYV